VEVGYSLLPAYQNKGFATEATAALIAAAYRNGAKQVLAETLPHLIASRRVMEKCGMVFVGPGSEDGVIRYAHAPSPRI
jgi:ribosomal-protein-alanine N-acetyltransferase